MSSLEKVDIENISYKRSRKFVSKSEKYRNQPGTIKKYDLRVPTMDNAIRYKISYTFTQYRIVSLCVCMKHFPHLIDKYLDEILTQHRFVKLMKLLNFVFEKSHGTSRYKLSILKIIDVFQPWIEHLSTGDSDHENSSDEDIDPAKIRKQDEDFAYQLELFLLKIVEHPEFATTIREFKTITAQKQKSNIWIFVIRHAFYRLWTHFSTQIFTDYYIPPKDIIANLPTQFPQHTKYFRNLAVMREFVPELYKTEIENWKTTYMSRILSLESIRMNNDVIDYIWQYFQLKTGTIKKQLFATIIVKSNGKKALRKKANAKKYVIRKKVPIKKNMHWRHQINEFDNIDISDSDDDEFENTHTSKKPRK